MAQRRAIKGGWGVVCALPTTLLHKPQHTGTLVAKITTYMHFSWKKANGRGRGCHFFFMFFFSPESPLAWESRQGSTWHRPAQIDLWTHCHPASNSDLKQSLPYIHAGKIITLLKITHPIKDLEGFPYFVLCILSLCLHFDPTHC